jgi:hypothetical protein
MTCCHLKAGRLPGRTLSPESQTSNKAPAAAILESKYTRSGSRPSIIAGQSERTAQNVVGTAEDLGWRFAAVYIEPRPPALDTYGHADEFTKARSEKQDNPCPEWENTVLAKALKATHRAGVSLSTADSNKSFPADWLHGLVSRLVGDLFHDRKRRQEFRVCCAGFG